MTDRRLDNASLRTASVWGLRAALLAGTAGLATAPAAASQPVPPNEVQDEVDVTSEVQADNQEIVITGELRQSIEDSLEAKRRLPVIGDAIVGDEVGDLPDISIAETLERIVGVTSDRFKGGASELSIRGLGAFLGNSYMNGREISSGSDGRDVNFGQFPSELINGAIIYKSQQASFIEGGVSGVIELQTLRPLDYNKTRIQGQALFGYSDYENRVDGHSPWEQRYTLSYVDQYAVGEGELGIAIGGQLRRGTAPEDVYTTSSTFRPCNTVELTPLQGSSNCAYDPDQAGNADEYSDQFYFVSNQYIYRAMQTESDRNAIMANVQYQPNSSWDINFDVQYSHRDDVENRHNLVIADGRRDITPIEISPTGALLAWAGETRLENQSVWRARIEDYFGAGFNAEYSTDTFGIAFDVGYSRTDRDQDEMDMRIRTNGRVLYEIDTRGLTVPNLTLTDVSDVERRIDVPFDLDDHDIYDNGARARRRLEIVDDEIFAVRLDGELYFDNPFFKTAKLGLRYADRSRVHDDGIDEEVALVAGDYLSPSAIAARRESFPVEDLFAGADTPMEGLTFATWEPRALFAALTGSLDAGLPTGSTLSPDDTDVTEKTYAAYAQVDYETLAGSTPIFGNFGIRAVKTDLTSIGISSPLVTMPGDEPGTIVVMPTGEVTINEERNDFINVLPSANVVFELAEDKLLRLAAYRALARPDQEAMSAALNIDGDADLDSIGSIVSASGNPALEPLLSWNADISFEWYAAEASSLSIAAYAKSLQTGFRTDLQTISLLVNDQPTSVVIGRTVNSNDKSSLYGFEIAGQHVFTGLPAPLDGLGIQASYNFAESDFEFPDPGVVDGVAIRDFTDPANIPGYSKHSANVNLFWESDRLSLRLAYKYRSDYFKPFRNDQNRFTGAQDFLDFSANYDLTRNFQLRFQALNILDEPNIMYRPTRDNLAQSDYSGRRYFVGLRGRF